jgi:hypothetical protein
MAMRDYGAVREPFGTLGVKLPSVTPSTGRNDPCPCGSGRKFKHCCLQKADTEDQARLRVRRAEGRMVDTLLPFALDRFGKAFFGHAWSDFFVGDPPDGSPLEVPEFDPMFVPWFLTLFVRDPHDDVVEAHWPDEPVGLHWLRTEAALLDDLTREWLLAACRSPMSVFVVTGVAPGRSADLRDIVTGRSFHVLEQSGTDGLKPTDLYFARVVTAGGISLMFGGAPFVLPADFHTIVLDWRDKLFGRRAITRQDLEDFDIEIRNLYLMLVDRLHHPAAPVLQNTDGDDLAPTTLTFNLSLPVSEAFERLKPLAMLGDEEHFDDVSTDESGVVTRVSLNWVKAGNRKNKAWTNTILGALRMEPGLLTAEVNSARRADRLIAEVKRRLGTQAVLVSREAETAADLFGRVAEARATREASDGPAPAADEPRAPELEALEDDLYREHLEAWIDTRVPALGNRTPRQVSRTPRGRERLEALLAGIATRERTDRQARALALAELRRQLGLSQQEQ